MAERSGDEWDEWFVNRPRGILSPKEREHLLGMLDEDPEEDAAAIRQREYRIRKHLYHAMVDFFLLGRFRLAKQVVLDWREDSYENPEKADTEFWGGLRGILELVFDTFTSGSPPESEEGIVAYEDIWQFQSLLSAGVSSPLVRRYAEGGVSVMPDVTLEIDLGHQIPLKEIKEIFDRDSNDHLFSQELEALNIAGLITNKELEEWKSQTPSNPDDPSEEYKKAVVEAYERRGREARWEDGRLQTGDS